MSQSPSPTPNKSNDAQTEGCPGKEITEAPGSSNDKQCPPEWDSGPLSLPRLTDPLLTSPQVLDALPLPRRRAILECTRRLRLEAQEIQHCIDVASRIPDRGETALLRALADDNIAQTRTLIHNLDAIEWFSHNAPRELPQEAFDTICTERNKLSKLMPSWKTLNSVTTEDEQLLLCDIVTNILSGPQTFQELLPLALAGLTAGTKDKERGPLVPIKECLDIGHLPHTSLFLSYTHYWGDSLEVVAAFAQQLRNSSITPSQKDAFVEAIGCAADRIASPTISYLEALRGVTRLLLDFTASLSSTEGDTERAITLNKILQDPLSLEKTILCLTGRGLLPAAQIRTLPGLLSFLSNLEALHDIDHLLRLPTEERRAFREYFADRFNVDNPPFHINPASRRAASKEVQIEFINQIDTIFHGQLDTHVGFWALTYLFRHSPISKFCPIDAMAERIGSQVEVIPSNDIRAFPGPGRILSSCDISRIFPPRDEEKGENYSVWTDELLPQFGVKKHPNQIMPGNEHTLLLFKNVRTISTRAFIAFSIPKNPFANVDGIPATLIDWNHHFDATGTQRQTLVDSRVLDSFFYEDPSARRYIPWEKRTAAVVEHRPPRESRTFSLEEVRKGVAPRTWREKADYITQNPPTFQALIERSKHFNTFTPIDLSAGSAFMGGLCNGLPPGEKRYFGWEQLRNFSRDNFGHAHKGHIQREYSLLKKLHLHHQQIYRCAVTLQKVRDLFKLVIGMDARGYIPDKGERKLDPQRALKQFCLFHHEYKISGAQDLAPALVLAPMEKWSCDVNTTTPFVLDGKTGTCFNVWDRPFTAEIDHNGAPSRSLQKWWMEKVVTFLNRDDHFWIAPRLVARANVMRFISRNSVYDD